MISKQQGSYIALLTELEHHGRPELQLLHAKLKRGTSLNDSELRHVSRFIEQTQQLTSLEQQVANKNTQKTLKLCQLVHDVSQLALENTQKKMP